MLYLQLINDISHILGQYSTATAEKQKKKIPKDKLEKLMQPLGWWSLWCISLMFISRINKKQTHEAVQLTYLIASTQL